MINAVRMAVARNRSKSDAIGLAENVAWLMMMRRRVPKLLPFYELSDIIYGNLCVAYGYVFSNVYTWVQCDLDILISSGYTKRVYL